MPNKVFIFRSLVIMYSVLLFTFLAKGYLITDSTFWIGICLIPYCVVSFKSGDRTLRLIPAVIFCLVGCLLTTTLTFRYLLVLSSTLLFVESFHGRLNQLVFFIFLIISPLFRYLSEVFTFPIRLKLSEWTGLVLETADFPVEISGNIIKVNGSDFSVDSACMGLQMLGFSFLAAVFLITNQERMIKRHLSFTFVSLIMAVVFGLNVFGNLVRILILVVFRIDASNPLHDLTGIFSLLIYIFLPTSYLVKYLFQYYSIPLEVSVQAKHPFKTAILCVNVSLVIMCAWFAVSKPIPNITHQGNPIIRSDKSYKMTNLPNGIIQYRNGYALIYSKAIPDFYSTEHSPYVCWRGSGYEFNNIKEEIVAGNHVYSATLQKGKEHLLTAWWFSNKKHNTISQLDWRWMVLRGEPDFQLINITADSQKDLTKAIKEWL